MSVSTPATHTDLTGADKSDTLVDVQHLKMYFPIRRGLIVERVVGHVHAVDDVSFHVRKGETLGLVGESGCGKSPPGRAVLQIYKPTAGSVLYNGVDVTKATGSKLRLYRRNMQMIFQDPFA